jgi:hypothetical protein
MFDVAAGVRCREDAQATWLQRSVERSPFHFAPATAGKQGKFIAGYRTGINAACYRDAIRDSRIASLANKLVWAR